MAQQSPPSNLSARYLPKIGNDVHREREGQSTSRYITVSISIDLAWLSPEIVFHGTS